LGGGEAGLEAGHTRIIRGMMDEFNALVLEFLVEPVCAELEDVARSFSVNCAIEVVE